MHQNPFSGGALPRTLAGGAYDAPYRHPSWLGTPILTMGDTPPHTLLLHPWPHWGSLYDAPQTFHCRQGVTPSPYPSILDAFGVSIAAWFLGASKHHSWLRLWNERIIIIAAANDRSACWYRAGFQDFVADWFSGSITCNDHLADVVFDQQIWRRGWSIPCVNRATTRQLVGVRSLNSEVKPGVDRTCHSCSEQWQCYWTDTEIGRQKYVQLQYDHSRLTDWLIEILYSNFELHMTRD